MIEGYLSLLISMNAIGAAVYADSESPTASFACDEITDALAAIGLSAKIEDITNLRESGCRLNIVLLTRENASEITAWKSEKVELPPSVKPEGYSIRKTSNPSSGAITWWVIGADSGGVMYGGLELAETIRVCGIDGIQEVDHEPLMAMRGTKFNIPLDVRTPSYTDVCDAAQKNIGEMWSFDFWRNYLDSLARYRYNFVSLWNLHPFPSMVRVPDYPDVALNDVMKSRIEWKENYPLNGNGFVTPEIMRDTEILKRMTIEEKIDFWRKVMRYARDRNIDFYVVTWNIFVYGTDGKYGITDDIDNPITIDYFRKSVKQMFLTYPLLAGIGLTTGENMPGASPREKEEWAFQTYGQGVLDAVAEQPGRKITFIHRQHQTGARDVSRRFTPLIEHEDIEFLFSFKYAKAHVYSSTKQPYHRDFVREIGDLKTIWTLRNDDVYYFRWGAPDFVREFIRNIPHDVSKGFYLGSDQYIWGREFLSKYPRIPRQIEIDKHWYHWMLWGRLGYDPDLSNDRLIGILQSKFPQVDASVLFEAWQEASMIYPTTTGFHWGALDFQWYIEACKSRPQQAGTESGFHDVNRFITLDPHPGTDNISISDYVDRLESGTEMTGTTPIMVADKLHSHANRAIGLIEKLKSGDNQELRSTLEDIRTIAYLGKYYAHKIRGATELAIFRRNGDPQHQRSAVRELTCAAEYWRLYVAMAVSRYENPLWTNRVGYCDWRAFMDEVLEDIAIAGGEPEIRSQKPTPGGTIMPAAEAEYCGAETRDESLEFTGSSDQQWIEWKIDLPEPRMCIIEIQYALDKGQLPAHISVNGENSAEMILWNTGGANTWGWDRLSVDLKRGVNTVRLTLHGRVSIAHLNLLSDI